MLATLLESRSKRTRSVGGAITSVTAHTLLIGAALYATAQARVKPTSTPEMVRPVFFPPGRFSVPVPRTTTAQRAIDGRRLAFVEPRVDVKIPAVDITDVVSTSVISKPGDFSPSPLTAIGTNSGRDGLAGTGGAPFRADQVEKQVSVLSGSAPPRYPEILRSSGVEGQVTAVFVVDEQGRAEESSIQFVRSDNQLFEDAVRMALRRMRFTAAQVGGRKVRQLVQMPFVFTLAR
jgi:periplasmic protein TonB